MYKEEFQRSSICSITLRRRIPGDADLNPAILIQNEFIFNLIYLILKIHSVSFYNIEVSSYW